MPEFPPRTRWRRIGTSNAYEYILDYQAAWCHTFYSHLRLGVVRHLYGAWWQAKVLPDAISPRWHKFVNLGRFNNVSQAQKAVEWHKTVCQAKDRRWF